MKLSPQFKKLLPYLILIVFGFLLYYQTLFFSFVYLDDNQLILNNQQTLREAGVFKIFTTDVFFSAAGNSFYYRPLLNISLLVDSLVGGVMPFIFHFTNLILHLLTVSLIFLIFKKYFFSKEISFFLALIFLSHPALTQAVAWIPGRNDSLLTVFVLMSFYLFLNFLKTDRLVFLWGHLFFLIFALFTKETAVFLPLLCIAYYYLFDYKFIKENLRDNILIILACWIGSVVVWYLFRTISLSGGGSLNGLLLSGWQNLSVILIYLGKFIFPFNLSVYPTIKNSTYWFGVLASVFIFLGIYLTSKFKWQHFLFGFLWFIIFLSPTLLNPDPSAESLFLEHRLYLPMFGLLICLAELYPFKNLKWQNNKVILIPVAVIILFSTLTIFQSQHFSNRLSFWTEAVKNSPNSAFVHNNLGAMNYLDGNFNQAKEQYLEALRLDPKQKLAHNNLGLIAMNNKNFAEAESEYKKELEINPYYDNSWNNLGILYANTKRFSEAIGAFTEAYRLNPNNLEAYNNLLILSAN